MAEPVHTWHILDKDSSADSSSLTICTFNVLAECLETEGWQWHDRRDWLLSEICRCEVDHFDFFEPELSKLGYQGYFVPKTKGFASMGKTEGQAIFAWTQRLAVEGAICWTSIDLTSGIWAERQNANKLGKWKNQIRPSPDVFQIVYGTDEKLRMTPQVAVGLFLRPHGSHQRILATCVHLKSKAKETPPEVSPLEVKEAQCEFFFTSMVDAANMWAPNTSVLCGGDFNFSLYEDERLAAVVLKAGFVDAYGGRCQSFLRGRRNVDFIVMTNPNATLFVQAILEVILDGPCSHQLYPSDHLVRAAQLLTKVER